MSRPFMYAIVGPDGRPWFSEDCVCEDREPLENELIPYLNGDEKPPKYRVVALYTRERSEPRGRDNHGDRIMELVAKFSDLAVELEKHSNNHIHDEIPDNLGAAVEGVCADRINEILKPYRVAAPQPVQPEGERVREAARMINDLCEAISRIRWARGTDKLDAAIYEAVRLQGIADAGGYAKLAATPTPASSLPPSSGQQHD